MLGAFSLVEVKGDKISRVRNSFGQQGMLEALGVGVPPPPSQ